MYLKKRKGLCFCYVGSTKAGINMKAVKEMGEIIKKTAILTQNRDSIGVQNLWSLPIQLKIILLWREHTICENQAVINAGVSDQGG